MFKSKRNLIFNGIDLADRLSYGREYFIIKDIRGRDYIPTSREVIQVPNKPGGYSKSLRTHPRVLEIEYYLKADSYASLRKKIEELNGIIYADGEARIQFADELDRVYYGEVNDASQTDESIKVHQGTLTIICTDPFKYAVTPKVVNGLVVHNQGTTDTPFTIEMVVTSSATNITVSDGKNQLTIGKYIPTAQYTEVLKTHDPFENLQGWSPITGLFSDYIEIGNMAISQYPFGYYGKYLYLTGISSAGEWRGRSIVKSVGTTKDFRVEGIFEIRRVVGQTSIVREYILLVDDKGEEVGRMGIFNNGPTTILEVQLGNGSDSVKIINSNNTLIFSDLVFCKITLSKKGNIYKASVFNIDKETGVEISEEITAFYTDYLNLYTKSMSAVAIHMARNEGETLGIYDLKVYEYVDESITNPNVVFAGDIVKFDTEKRTIMINGQIRNVTKNIQSDYFNLSTGRNALYVSPDVTSDHKVTFRERYL